MRRIRRSTATRSREPSACGAWLPAAESATGEVGQPSSQARHPLDRSRRPALLPLSSQFRLLVDFVRQILQTSLQVWHVALLPLRDELTEEINVSLTGRGQLLVPRVWVRKNFHERLELFVLPQ